MHCHQLSVRFELYLVVRINQRVQSWLIVGKNCTTCENRQERSPDCGLSQRWLFGSRVRLSTHVVCPVVRAICSIMQDSFIWVFWSFFLWFWSQFVLRFWGNLIDTLLDLPWALTVALTLGVDQNLSFDFFCACFGLDLFLKLFSGATNSNAD